MRAGEKWRIPFHNPQAESGGLWDGNRHKSCILRSHKPRHVHAKTPSTWCTYCVGLPSDETRARRLTAAKLHGTSPRGEQSSTEAVAKVQMDDRKKISWARKSQQRRVMWPLREGREIWGVDGAFASMSWWRHCVRDGVAPPANELAWFYMGSDIGHAVGVPEAVNAALSSPMKENQASALAIPVLWPEPCWKWVRWTEEKKHHHGAVNLKGLEWFWIKNGLWSLVRCSLTSSDNIGEH